MINRKKLGYRLSSLVAGTGRKQCEIASDIGVQESSLSQWINGHWVPSVECLYKFAHYFGKTIDELLEGCVE